MVQITTVIVEQQNAPIPDGLQKTGAILSQGGTNTAPGTKTLLTQLADALPFLSAAQALTSLTWSGSVVTAATAAPHGYTVGDTLLVTIAGEVPVGYNGTYTATITGASAFTYPLTSNPGAQSTAGTFIAADESELLAQLTTFFAQGSSVAIYVLELGPGNVDDGVAYLTNWILLNPGFFYAYLVPSEWDGNTNYLALLAANAGSTAKVYFYTTTTLATYAAYGDSLKDSPILIESPSYGVWPANALTAISQGGGGVVTATTTTAHGVQPGDWFQIAGVSPSGYNGYWQALAGTTGSTLEYFPNVTLGAETVLGTLVVSYYASAGTPATEFSMAGPFWRALSASPSNSNRVPPFNLGFLTDVTPWPQQGNAAILQTLKAANVWTVQTGAAGNLSNTLIVGGNMLDGNPWNYWYATDWAQIEVVIAINAAVIDGSNTTANPLYLNQDGINRLQAVGAQVLSDGTTFGLLLGQVIETELNGQDFADAIDAGQFFGNAVINAVSFVDYYTTNPGDYAIGKYAGFTCLITPLRGFDAIQFTIVVYNFPVP